MLVALLISSIQQYWWCNGLACLQQWSCYLQGPEFRSHLRPVEFFTCNKVSLRKQSNPNSNICAMCPNYLAQGYRGLQKLHHYSLEVCNSYLKKLYIYYQNNVNYKPLPNFLTMFSEVTSQNSTNSLTKLSLELIM